MHEESALDARGHERLCHAKSFLYSQPQKSDRPFAPNSSAGSLMPRHPLAAQELHEVPFLASQWGKIIARRAFGDAGPALDVDLDAMEQFAQAAAAGLTEGTLQT